MSVATPSSGPAGDPSPGPPPPSPGPAAEVLPDGRVVHRLTERAGWVAGRCWNSEDWLAHWQECEMRENGLDPSLGSSAEVSTAQDWADLAWHIKEAQHLNQLPRRWPHPTLRRLWRQQGRLNRMLLIAMRKAGEILRDQERAILRGSAAQGQALPAGWSQATRTAWLDWENRYHRCQQANHPVAVRFALLKRLWRDQGRFNATLNQTLETLLTQLRLLAAAMRALEGSCAPPGDNPWADRPGAEAWPHLVWHIKEAAHLQATHPAPAPAWLARWRRPQEEINRLHAVALHYGEQLLRHSEAALQSLAPAPEGPGKSGSEETRAT